MKWRPVLSKQLGRRPQDENKVPFRELLPLSLKNEVQGRYSKTMEGKCLHEMMLLFKCWKDHDFHDLACTSYMQQLNQCYSTLLKDTIAQKESRKQEIPVPNAKSLTSKQITYLLRNYPTV